MSEPFAGNHLGTWWIPGVESNKVSGLLSFDETGHATLELSGFLEQSSTLLPHPSREYPVLVGIDNRSLYYSLFECRLSRWTVTTGKQTSSALVLRSEHVAAAIQVSSSINDLIPSEVQLRSPMLADWWIAPGLDAQRNGTTVTQTQLTPTPVNLGTWGDTSLDLVCESIISHSQSGPRPVDTTRDTYLRMTSGTKHPTEYYIQLLDMICTFVAIAFRRLMDFPSVIANSEDQFVEFKPGRRLYLDIPILWPIRGCIMQGNGDAVTRLLSVENQTSLLVRMLARWYSEYDHLEPIADTLLNSFQHPSLPRRERFLAAVFALEGLHRLSHNTPPCSTGEWKNKIDSIINPTASPENQVWARNLLNSHNEPNLITRLAQLCDENRAFFGLDDTRRDKYAKETARLRGKFAHSLSRSVHAKQDNVRLDVRTRQSENLLLVSLFKYLGWDDADSTGEWQGIGNTFEQ